MTAIAAALVRRRAFRPPGRAAAAASRQRPIHAGRRRPSSSASRPPSDAAPPRRYTSRFRPPAHTHRPAPAAASGLRRRGPAAAASLSAEEARWRAPSRPLLDGFSMPSARSFSAPASATTPSSPGGPEKLRVAVVGGGAAGLSTALHLAPLAASGLIASPVDVYEMSNPLCGDVHPDSDPSRPKDERDHLGSGAIGRTIGVGIWSTALLPLASTGRESHAELLRALEGMGRYVGRVGYRTPNGKWLAQSELNTSRCSKNGGRDDEALYDDGEDGGAIARDFGEVPGLLFLREQDLLRALREAAAREEREHGTIRVHYGPGRSSPPDGPGSGSGSAAVKVGSTTVAGIRLPLDRSESPTPCYGFSGRIEFADGSLSPASAPYHLVVGAGGMHSALRLRYAGRSLKQMQTASAGSGGAVGEQTSGITGHRGLGDGGMGEAYYRSGMAPGGVTREQWAEWALRDTAESNAIEDRGYTVFRGNAEIGGEDAGMDGMSFQTWGEEKSMRFAAVTMSYPDGGEGEGGGDEAATEDGRVERQVWFATTNDHSIAAVKDAAERKERLKEAFNAWHNPVTQLIESTPADSILMECGVAHKYSIRPVFNLADVVDYKRKLQRSKKGGSGAKGGGGASPASSAAAAAAGPGPALIFVGDASMTVDPVLAQGFTFAMESAAELAKSLGRCCGPDVDVRVAVPPPPPRASAGGGGDDAADSDSSSETCSLQFSPDRLRSELNARHNRRYDRLMCLLRSTELVQALAQPESGTASGFLSRNLVRPAMRLAPEFVKRRIFTAMMRYSLGLTGGGEAKAKAEAEAEGGSGGGAGGGKSGAGGAGEER